MSLTATDCRALRCRPTIRLRPVPSMSSVSSNPLQWVTTTPAWGAYERQLSAQPVLTKGLTSLVGFALGDIIAQTLVEQAAIIDVARVVKFSSFGFLVHGTTCHFFYNFLDCSTSTRCRSSTTSSSPSSALRRRCELPTPRKLKED